MVCGVGWLLGICLSALLIGVLLFLWVWCLFWLLGVVCVRGGVWLVFVFVCLVV